MVQGLSLGANFDMSDSPYTVVIVGGGLVGSLAAVHLAKRGWTIHVYELRKGNFCSR